MLAEQAVSTDCFLALNVSCVCLRIGFDEPLVYEVLAITLFKPQPGFTVNIVSAERNSVLLPSRQIVAGLRPPLQQQFLLTTQLIYVTMNKLWTHQNVT